jgi:hypothetical protein
MTSLKTRTVGTIAHTHPKLKMGLARVLAEQLLANQAAAVAAQHPIPEERRTPHDSEVRAAIKGTRDMDQIFVNETHGYFNAGKMLRMVLARPTNFVLTRVPLTEGLLNYVLGFVELDQQLLADMTPERRDEPILGVELVDAHPLLIIDGHHRVVKRWNEGFRDVSILIMPNQKLHMIHARHDQV